MTSLALIVPVYNEEESLKRTLDELRAAATEIRTCDCEIICIDDGSTDRTPEILRQQPGITVLTHERNRGYGAALRTALHYTDAEWAFIVDADGTYPLDQLADLWVETGGADMVVGARSGPGIAASFPKRLARWVLRKMVHILTGVMVPDLNSGMRLFRRSVYEQFGHLLPTGFSFTTTMTVACLYSQYRVKYVPIDYQDRIGRSNIRPIRDFFGFVILTVRLASYFEPLTFFVPASAAIVVVGIVRGIRDVFVANGIGILAALLVFLAIQIFAVGILADIVVRRSSGSGAKPARMPEFKIFKNPHEARE